MTLLTVPPDVIWMPLHCVPQRGLSALEVVALVQQPRHLLGGLHVVLAVLGFQDWRGKIYFFDFYPGIRNYTTLTSQEPLVASERGLDVSDLLEEIAAGKMVRHVLNVGIDG